MESAGFFKIDVEEQFPRLPAAPIVEAVIHWVARSEKSVAPDDVRKQLTERLSDFAECQAQQEPRFDAHLGPDGSSREIRERTWRGFRLTSGNKLHVVQFNRDGLIFSRLEPYEHWETFANAGVRIWRVFAELLEPSEIQRLGVRFINRIAPVDRTKLGKYLARPPRCLDPLGLRMERFLHQSLYDVPDHPFRINVVQTIQPPAPPRNEGNGLILDIDVFTTQAFEPSDATLQCYLSQMRWLKNKTFFSLLTKSAIKRFRGSR